MRTSFDAIICGAGPAGSSAAILLARAGWSVALVEKQQFPRRKVCGECIAASNLPLLEALGVGAAFEAVAGPELRKVAFMNGCRHLIADLPAAAHAKYRWGRALGRETLDTLLLAQARSSGALVLQPMSMQAIAGTAGAWNFHVRPKNSQALITLHAPVAIDAHGSWETLPSAHARERQAHRASDLFAFKANFRHASLEAGLLPVLSFEGGYGGMVVADADMTTLACCIRRDRLEAWRHAMPQRSAGDVVEVMLKRSCAGVRVALQSASRISTWLSAGPLDPGIRLGANDAIFRIGNAAGEAHPIIGEGISMALQSAKLLCTHLLETNRCSKASGASWQRDVAQRYAAEWHRHFKSRLWLAAAFAQLAMRPPSAALLMALVRSRPSLLTQSARWAGKVNCAI